ncbi:hypothetical protein EDM53_05880 [Rickettsiales endosymbiont of Peranema trichophorum]|uniref:TSUP family transporter n=1 Tax=Rickettsiales endosymbiont of Peranema trichophorum TaxID=2486577 RepID=UPI001023ADCC|nr:TSUP family transporter [Rickettsiales endosymbiont of Peranema trichophorum]RZI45084.1 hypothetical protein EDM53_05880 [Rickettsiales endosymbiont of Peranema trichophorum]
MFIEDSFLTNYFYFATCFLIILCFVAGYIDSIAGGAGLILIPAFLAVGMNPYLALGQEKLVSTMGTMSAIRNFIKSKSVVWEIIPLGIVTSLIGSIIGSNLILVVEVQWVYYVIIVLLPFGLLLTLFRGLFVGLRSNIEVKQHRILTAITCLMVGFYDGFFGPGTGSIFIISLCCINGMSPLNASATSKIFNLSSNLGAFLSFFMANQMAVALGIPMIIASIVGNHIGSMHAISATGNIIKNVLVLTVVMTSLTLIWRFLSL